MRLRRELVYSLLTAAVGASATWGALHWYRTLPLRNAQSSYVSGRYLEAAALAEAWLTDHPGDQRAMLVTARSYARLDRWAEAEAYFAQVPLRDLDDFHLRARGLVVRKHYDEAAVVFEQTIQRFAMDGESLQRLSAIRGEQLRMEESLIFARRLCQIPSHRVIGYVLTGLLEMQFREPAKAVESLETALSLSPDLEGSPEKLETILNRLGEALLMLGRPADAERYALRAREVSSTPDPCWILGRVRQQQGDEDGAKRYWEEAVARDPQHNAALRELGRLALLQQQPEQALAWLLRAREAKPDDTATAQALAATYRHLGQEEAAVEVLKAIPSSAQGEGPSTPVGPTGVPRR